MKWCAWGRARKVAPSNSQGSQPDRRREAGLDHRTCSVRTGRSKKFECARCLGMALRSRRIKAACQSVLLVRWPQEGERHGSGLVEIAVTRYAELILDTGTQLNVLMVGYVSTHEHAVAVQHSADSLVFVVGNA